MITGTSIIKFSEYKDIQLVSRDCFVYKHNKKSLNIKGINVETYIYPIFKRLFQPATVNLLFKKIEDYYSNTDTLISYQDFYNILLKLFNIEIIEILSGDFLCNDNMTGIDSLKQFNISCIDMCNLLKNKSITIINFLEYTNIKHLINQLSMFPFKKVNLVNLYSEILNINTLEQSINLKEINIVNEKYCNVNKIKKYLSSTNLVVTLQSAENIELNTFINCAISTSKTPWLNCVVNDLIIEIGPFVVPGKTACYECYKYMNSFKYENIIPIDDKNDSIYFKTNKIFRVSNIYILFGYLLDEILKFMCFEYIECLPKTINNTITIYGLKLQQDVNPILKIPGCKVCN